MSGYLRDGQIVKKHKHKHDCTGILDKTQSYIQHVKYFSFYFSQFLYLSHSKVRLIIPHKMKSQNHRGFN